MKARLGSFAALGPIIAAATGALTAGQAVAQTAPGVEAAVVSRPAELAPPLSAPLQPAAESFTLPPLQQLRRSPQALGSQQPSFVLKHINVTGSNLLSDAEVTALKRPYLDRPVTLGDVLALRDELTQALIAKGYVTSGAVVGPQNISDSLEIKLIEGKLTTVELTGTSYLTKSYVSQRLPVDESRPLNINELKSAYQLLLEDRDIARINARLEPGETSGQSLLRLTVEEKKRNSLTAFVASDRSPSVGETRAGLSGRRASVLTAGDSLSGEISATQGLTEGRLVYSRPVSARNTTLSVYAQASHARILDKPLNALDAISDSLYAGSSLTLPLISRPGKSLNLTGSVDHLEVSTDLMGQPFSFSPGAVNGKTAYTTARTTLSYAYFSRTRSLSASLSLSRGIGGNKRAQGIDRDFTYADLSASGFLRLNDRDQKLLLRGSARFTDDKLYATEMFVIGGINTVRGYRQNALLGNQGYWVSAEYVIPVGPLVASRGAKSSFISPDTFTLGLFADAGEIKTSAPLAGQPTRISSVGAHLLWKPTPRIDADLYVSAPLDKSPYKGNYQDKGLGFRLGYRF